MRLLLLSVLLMFAQPALAIQLLASIHPLALLATAIGGERIQVETLLPASASPHDYQLRPSDMQRIGNADLVVWLGPELERFLTKPLAMKPSIQKLALADAAKAELPIEHSNNHPHVHEESHDDGALHPWLDPEQALIIAEKIAAALSQQDSAGAILYQENLAQLKSTITQLDLRLRQQLASVQDQGYFVFHDAYEGFELHYGLNNLGAIAISPERKPGARQLLAIRQQLEAHQVRCLFAEPQFPSALMDRLSDGLPIKRGTLDPLGSSANSYPDLLQQMADSFSQCLK